MEDNLDDLIKGLRELDKIAKTIQSFIPLIMIVAMASVIMEMCYTLDNFYVPKDVLMIKKGCEEFLYYKSPTEWIHIKNKF